METIENIEIENPEIFLSIGSFCSLAEVQKFLHVDARNKASWEHNVPSGDFEPGSEFIKMDIEINAHFDVFFEPDEAKVMKTGDFEFSIARHAIKALGKPSCWAKKMLADNFTDAVFHVGEEGTDFPTTVKAHKSVLSGKSMISEVKESHSKGSVQYVLLFYVVMLQLEVQSLQLCIRLTWKKSQLEL